MVSGSKCRRPAQWLRLFLIDDFYPSNLTFSAHIDVYVPPTVIQE